MNIKKVLASTVAIWIFGILYTYLTCAWLFSWVYEIEPVVSKDPASMMLLPNLIGSNLSGLLIAFIFASVFAILYNGIPQEGVKKGLMYGFLVWLVGGLSGVITMPFYMNIAPALIFYWVVNFLVGSLIMGLIVGAIYKVKK